MHLRLAHFGSSESQNHPISINSVPHSGSLSLILAYIIPLELEAGMTGVP